MKDYAKIYDRPQLERWYLVDHLTLDEIGVLLGLTRQGVQNRIRRCRIDGSTASRFRVVCDTCGKSFETTRKRWRLSEKHFCGAVCSAEYKRGAEYREGRNAQRMARKAYEEHFEHELLSGEVLEYKDGDSKNLTPGNLRLFGSHRERLAHRQRQGTATAGSPASQ